MYYGVISTKGSDDMNYLDMIPSSTEREYLKNKGFVLPDKMTATLIYNAVPDYHDRMSRLEAYAGETTRGYSMRIRYLKDLYLTMGNTYF